MNILLTGANGFIGSYFHTSYKKIYKIKTFSFLNNNFNNLNLNDTNTIIHLSALVHQMGGASKDDYYKINVKNTLLLAKKAKSTGVKHFVFMSTIKVYGEEHEEAYTEDTLCHPQDDYGKSKLEAEQALLAIEDESFKVSIIRTPVVYGAGVKANILSLVTLVKKISILPFPNIQNKRSMVYVGNLCAIIDKIIQTNKSGIFLAADNQAVSTTELINLIAKTLNKKVFLVHIPFFPTLLKMIKPSIYKRLYESLEVDNTLTKQKLDFSNVYSIEEGIKMMIKDER